MGAIDSLLSWFGLRRVEKAHELSSGVYDDNTWVKAGAGPNDRPWGEVYADLEDSLDAWRKNMLIRRLVNVTRAYVVGKGIQFQSKDPSVDAFIQEFWHHPRNRMDRRLGPICDSLTRDGEVFPVLYTDPQSGMSYVRLRPAKVIQKIITDPNDYEQELRYIEPMTTGERVWLSPYSDPFVQSIPVMMHFYVNRAVGAVRGESDVRPVIAWAMRYVEWLKDRVRLNKVRTRAGVMDITMADDSMVKTKRQSLKDQQPLKSGMYVHGPGESVEMHDIKVNADETADDGKALRLAVASGSNMSLHFYGEGEATNYATAKEMGEPTARFFTDRQTELIWMLMDLLTVAYQRYCVINKCAPVADLQIVVIVPELARDDNQSLAQAAQMISQALELAKANGWIEDEQARELLLKFAGERVEDQ